MAAKGMEGKVKGRVDHELGSAAALFIHGFLGWSLKRFFCSEEAVGRRGAHDVSPPRSGRLSPSRVTLVEILLSPC